MFCKILRKLTFLWLLYAGPLHAQEIVQPVPLPIQNLIRQYTWQPGCPVAPDQLALVKLNYWGFDQRVHQGTLIVNQNIAPEVVNIFQILLSNKFPIARMQPLYIYRGNEAAAMADNDTFAFICRPITGKKNIFSWHAYGRAIDINPLLNPYVKGNTVLPPQGKPYLSRNKPVAGMITKNGEVYRAFIQQGWQWGGDWQTLKDYQHFEKPD